MYGYHPGFLTLSSGETSLVFEVQACNDAHIYLGEYFGVTMSNAYEIVIGGWGNSRYGDSGVLQIYCPYNTKKILYLLCAFL